MGFNQISRWIQDDSRTNSQWQEIAALTVKSKDVPQNCPAILGIAVFHPSFTHLWNSPMDSSVNHLANPANTGLGSPTGKHYKTLEFGLPYCQTIARSNFRHQKPGKTTKFKPCSGTCEAADRITFCGKALPLEASAAISWNHSR